MRAAALLVLVLGILTVSGFLFLGGERGSGGTEGSGIGPGDALAPAGALEEEDAPRAEVQLARLEAGAAAAPSAADPAVGRTSLDGRVVDRFGLAVPGERVFLLAADQGHPPAGADLREYVTARSSRTGLFSLSVPHAGPWRVGVGMPGTPRVPPGDPHRVEGGVQAEVVVDGTSGLEVVFDELPEGEDTVTLEVLTLREEERPTNRGPRSRIQGPGEGPRSERFRPLGETESPRGAGGRGARGAGASPPGGDDGTKQDDGGDGGPGGPGQEQEGPNRRGKRRGPGFGGASDGAQSDEEAEAQGQEGARTLPGSPIPLGPPPEVWRSFTSYRLTDDERGARAVRLGALPTGSTARLAVRVGSRRWEGDQRFTLVPNTLVEVRVLSLPEEDGLNLSYVTTVRPVSEENPATGVYWRE